MPSPLIAALDAASTAATEAYTAHVAVHYTAPAYAVVENASGDWLHDPSQPTRVVDTLFDVCGFVWVDIDNRRNNGAPGKKLLAEFKRNSKADFCGEIRKLGAYSLSHSGYDGSWHLSGHGSDSVTGGTGNGALGAARAGAQAFVESMTAAGYPGMRVESRID